MDLIERAKSILLQPRETWGRIEAESATTASLFTGYLMILAAIPAVCGFIGMSLIGFGGFGFTVRVPLLAGLANMVVSYGLSLAGVFVLALIVDALAPTFGGVKSSIQALKLVVYASTAALLGGVFSLLPSLSMLGLLAALYSIYLIYTGLPVLMKSPAEKSVAYTAVVLVAGIVMAVIIGAVGSLFMPHGAMMGGLGGAGGNVSVTTPHGKVSIDTAGLEAASKKMEEAARQMEQAQKSQDPNAMAAATGNAMAAAAGAMGGAQGAVAVQSLKAALPEQLAGLARTSVEVQDGAAMGLPTSQARAEYGSGDRQVRVEIVDLGGLSGLAQMAGMVQGEKETDGHVEKTWQANGRTMQEEYHKDGSHAEAKAILKNGLVVSVEADQTAIKDVRGFLEKIDLGALENLPRKGKS